MINKLTLSKETLLRLSASSSTAGAGMNNQGHAGAGANDPKPPTSLTHRWTQR